MQGSAQAASMLVKTLRSWEIDVPTDGMEVPHTHLCALPYAFLPSGYFSPISFLIYW